MSLRINKSVSAYQRLLGRELKDDAQVFIAQNELTQKIQELKQRLAANPYDVTDNLFAAMLATLAIVPANTFNRKEHLERAAKLGNSTAKLELALEYLQSTNGNTIEKGIKLLKELIAKGHVTAMHSLAYHYLMEEQYKEAAKLLEAVRAKFKCEKNPEPNELIVDAHMRLSEIYVEQFSREKPEFLQRAERVLSEVEQWSIEAAYSKNEILFKKIFLEKDENKRKEWRDAWVAGLKTLSEKKSGKAKLELGLMHIAKFGDHPYLECKEDLSVAESYLKEAFQLDKSEEIAFGLYELYRAKKDFKEAESYLRTAAKADHLPAVYAYAAYLIDLGKENKVHFETGMQMMALAIAAEHPEALFWDFRAEQARAAYAKQINDPKAASILTQAYQKLEKATSAGSIYALAWLSRLLLADEYRAYKTEPYADRMERAKECAQKIIDTPDARHYHEYKPLKQIARDVLAILDKVIAEKATVKISEVTGEITIIPPKIENVTVESETAKKSKRKKKNNNSQPVYFPPKNKNKFKGVAEEEKQEKQMLSVEIHTSPVSTTSVLRKALMPKAPIYQVEMNQPEVQQSVIQHVEEGFSLEQFYILLFQLADKNNFLMLIDLILVGVTYDKSVISLAMGQLSHHDAALYELLIPKLFMSGNAAKNFSVLIEHGVMQNLFPFINYCDKDNITWLENKLKTTDSLFHRNNASFHPQSAKFNETMAYICSCFIAVASTAGYDYSTIAIPDHGNLATAWPFPEAVKVEIAKDHYKMLVALLAGRYREINYNPYATQCVEGYLASISSTLNYHKIVGNPQAITHMHGSFFSGNSTESAPLENLGQIQHPTYGWR